MTEPAPAPWPRMMTPPTQVLEWLGTLRPADTAGQKCVVTLRWLLLAELERAAPGPAPDFTPNAPMP